MGVTPQFNGEEELLHFNQQQLMHYEAFNPTRQVSPPLNVTYLGCLGKLPTSPNTLANCPHSLYSP